MAHNCFSNQNETIDEKKIYVIEELVWRIKTNAFYCHVKYSKWISPWKRREDKNMKSQQFQIQFSQNSQHFNESFQWFFSGWINELSISKQLYIRWQQMSLWSYKKQFFYFYSVIVRIVHRHITFLQKMWFLIVDGVSYEFCWICFHKKFSRWFL